MRLHDRVIMNSHVQIPKSILKNFAYKAGKDGWVVDYLDLNDNQIKTEKIGKLDTIENYYSEEFEKYLSDNIEGPFGEISKKIRNISSKKIDRPILTINEENVVLDFFEFALRRSNMLIDKMNKYSFKSPITEKTLEEIILLSRGQYFKECYISIITNKTKIDFIIPRNCFYWFKSETTNNYYYILPFTPKVAVILMPNEEKTIYSTKENLRQQFYVDEYKIRIMNMYALAVEQGINNQFIVGNKSELIELKENL